jgi:N6-adenosine-specific RNA methylase IME4
MSASILFQNTASSIILIDVPTSIQECQAPFGQGVHRQLLSANPIEEPFPTPEPKDADAWQHSQAPAALLAELMTIETVRSALNELKLNYAGPLCLSRAIRKDQSHSASLEVTGTPSDVYTPDGSHYLHGTIQDHREEFISNAPNFDLMVIDPPWPNRSVKRKKNSYSTTTGVMETRKLLESLPVASKLEADGLVAVWTTNKRSLYSLMTSPGGILSLWGLEIICEWIWLKITSNGEPIVSLESQWKKPWERLLIAKRQGSQRRVSPKILIGVPDVHSRKPNLRALFQEVFWTAEYSGVEIFARNLTAGWWSWGDEVLRFQNTQEWVSDDSSAVNHLQPEY